MNKNTLGIYIHVPFCKSKCPYCDFYSLTEFETESYVNKVCIELEKWGKKLGKTVNTIYFGGGTPSLLKSDDICKIIDSVNKNFEVSDPEITMEVNPADYSIVDFEKLKFSGLNRVSVGAQSIDEIELKALGRRHNVNDVSRTYNHIKSAGINNISFDIMLGIPNQSEKSILRFVDFCNDNKIPHISAYLLKIEKGTEFYKNKKMLQLPGDDESADIYTFVSDFLKKRGYNHYEISNFALKGFESRHNLKYWSLEEYLGVGPSAHSLINGSRFYYKNSLNEFIKEGKILNEGIYEPKKEYIMLRLRLARGLTQTLYKERFGENIPKNYFERAEKYSKHGLIIWDNEGIRLTEKGFLVSNLLISDILE